MAAPGAQAPIAPALPPLRAQPGNAFADLDTPAPRRPVRGAALAHALRTTPPPPEQLAGTAPLVARLEALLRKMGSDA